MSFDEISEEINRINENEVDYQELLYHENILAEKAKKLSSNELVNIISDENNRNYLRTMFIQIIEHYGKTLTTDEVDKLISIILNEDEADMIRKNIVWFAILICLPLILIGCNKSIDKNDTISSADNKIPELIYESEYQSDSEHFQVYQTGSVNSSDEDMCYENVIFDFETISPEDAQNFHRLEEGYTYIRISDIDCYYLESYKDQPNKTTFNCIAITDKCEKYFLGFQVEGERFFGNKEIKKILCDFEVVE